jgi:cellulose biosynthesis protein BcsQ
MPDYQGTTMGGIRDRQGQEVPVVAFYSVQGGVGKSTLARKFAELVTVAPGREGRKPNVLLVDLDVEAQGLSFRLAQGLRQSFRTVHEIIAERNVSQAQAITVTGAVSLAQGNPLQRGQLYLMPAAPPEARGLFDTIATVEKDELIKLLLDMIKANVLQYDISCVVIDCAPGANPYTAAAATLADIPFLIGRNEQATYDQIRVLPERFREWYDRFQPAKQRVIINAVAVKDLYASRAQQYSIFYYIPLSNDVIKETEGLAQTGSLQTLLFEKYMVDIIKQVFAGKNHLIPEAPDVVGQEWLDTLGRLSSLNAAPKLRRLRPLIPLLPLGVALVLIGILLIAVRQVINALPATLTNIGIVSAVVDVLFVGAGWYALRERQRILIAAHKLSSGGAEEIFRKLKEGASQRRELDELRKLAATIPAEALQPQAHAGQGVKKERE